MGTYKTGYKCTSLYMSIEIFDWLKQEADKEKRSVSNYLEHQLHRLRASKEAK